MGIRFFNTMARRLEDFEPISAGSVLMYTCGPTVYDFAHIGNFRAYTWEDCLRRFLKHRGFKVTQIMNITDVDDKIIAGAKAAGGSIKEFTAPFAEAFLEDMKTLRLVPQFHYPAG